MFQWPIFYFFILHMASWATQLEVIPPSKTVRNGQYFLEKVNSNAGEDNQDQQKKIIDQIKDECPINARCNKEGKKYYEAWLAKLSKPEAKQANAIKNNNHLAQAIGIPMTFWMVQKNANQWPKTPYLTWNTPCSNHNMENKSQIFYSLHFVKSGNVFDKTTEEERNILITSDHAMIQMDKKIQIFRIPRMNTPLYIKNDMLFFINELEGNYYYFSLNSKGIIELADYKKVERSAEKINCPKNLIEAWENQAKKSKYPIHQVAYCKNIWNETMQKYHPAIFSKGCIL